MGYDHSAPTGLGLHSSGEMKHIAVSLKSDNLGIGAGGKRKREEDPRAEGTKGGGGDTSLGWLSNSGAFERLLERLNGSSASPSPSPAPQGDASESKDGVKPAVKSDDRKETKEEKKERKRLKKLGKEVATEDSKADIVVEHPRPQRA